MSEIPLKDNRGFFKLPQKPEQNGYGYYAYGAPGAGAGQFAHPGLVSLLNLVEHRWQGMDNRKIGFGNISLADGAVFDPHKSHRSGLDIDVRPLRLDGLELPVTWQDTKSYDRDATARLIKLFFDCGAIKVIYFNDKKIPRVISRSHHDNHFHVTIIA